MCCVDAQPDESVKCEPLQHNASAVSGATTQLPCAGATTVPGQWTVLSSFTVTAVGRQSGQYLVRRDI